jgi:hypothetical protein
MTQQGKGKIVTRMVGIWSEEHNGHKCGTGECSKFFSRYGNSVIYCIEYENKMLFNVTLYNLLNNNKLQQKQQ